MIVSWLCVYSYHRVNRIDDRNNFEFFSILEDDVNERPHYALCTLALGIKFETCVIFVLRVDDG